MDFAAERADDPVPEPPERCGQQTARDRAAASGDSRIDVDFLEAGGSQSRSLSVMDSQPQINQIEEQPKPGVH